MKPNLALSCPIPISQYDRVQMAHGGGGRLMNQLIETMFMTAFKNVSLDQRHDSAVLPIDHQKIAFTTDGYVVKPLFFPGGDIGDLAINGTVNDLAMSGARPLYLSLGFIIEEGFLMDDLWRVVLSLRDAAAQANVRIVTGDTKVVDKGKGDGIFITSSGVGVVEHDLTINATQIQPGDAILVNGDLARHGVTIMASRDSLVFESDIQSDTAPLAETVLDLINQDIEVHCLRDLTRGGLSSALNELAFVANVTAEIEETAIPIREDVLSACEMLGLDPLHIANEGRFVAFVPANQADRAVQILRRHPESKSAAKVGTVKSPSGAPVLVKSRVGAQRVLDMLSGEQLPRIC